MKRRSCKLHPLAVAILLGGCSTSPSLPGTSWKVEPTQSVRHAGVSAEGYVTLGRERETRGARGEALDAYRKAVETDPGYPPGWNALGVMRMQLGETEDGLRALERATTLAPAASHLHNNLGYALMLAGRTEMAVTSLQRAVALDPDNRRAWTNLAEAYRKQGIAPLAEAAEAHAAGKAPAPSPVAAVAPTVTPATAQAIAVSPSLPAPVAAVSPVAADSTVRVQPIVDTQSAPAIASTRAPLQADTASETGTVLVKVANNVFELRNAPRTQAETHQEAAAIVTAAARPAAVAAMPAPAEKMPIEVAAPVRPPVLARAVRYEITNGQGGEGLARRLAGLLGKDGFPRPRLMNHSAFDQAQTYIEYRSGYKDAATAFADMLPFRPALRPNDGTPLVADVRLMLGKDLNTSDACSVLGLCSTYAQNSAPTRSRSGLIERALPVSDGVPQGKRPPSDQI